MKGRRVGVRGATHGRVGGIAGGEASAGDLELGLGWPKVVGAGWGGLRRAGACFDGGIVVMREACFGGVSANRTLEKKERINPPFFTLVSASRMKSPTPVQWAPLIFLEWLECLEYDPDGTGVPDRGVPERAVSRPFETFHGHPHPHPPSRCSGKMLKRASPPADRHITEPHGASTRRGQGTKLWNPRIRDDHDVSPGEESG